MTLVSAPPGSGKTVLVRSWIAEAGRAPDVAWVSVGADDRDPQRFWLSVLGALRQTAAGSALVRELTAAPDLDGWAIVERLLKDLAPLADRIWLVLDDAHELGSGEARHQLELLIMRAPQQLRFILAARHDLRLGLHRLRLEGDLTEIREPDLRFTLDEARKLVSAAGVELTEPTMALLHERTEGWAAGLRLAALSLAGHPDPARFAEEFSGSERTVTEYLLAEVLERQSDTVRRLLLRTSILERVNGELADLLTGGIDGERILQDLEQANAFVVSLDAARSWFRYHRLFADLLQLEMRRSARAEIFALHALAAQWFAEHGYPVEAIRQAQAARDWDLAGRLLADHWPSLHLDGHDATVHELIARFPAGAAIADAQLAAVAAADELAYGSLEAAERHLDLAERGMASVPDDRRAQAALLLAITRLLLARQRGNLPTVATEAQRLQAIAEAPQAARPGLGQDLRALALIGLGITGVWSGRFEEADRHLEQGVALTRRIGRPYLEFTGLAFRATLEIVRSHQRAAEHCRRAIALAERHGWTDEPAACTAYMTLGAVLTNQGRLEEAEPWLQRAQQTVRAEAQPVAGIGVYLHSAAFELARGRNAEARAAFSSAERLAGLLAVPNPLVVAMHAFRLQAQIRAGETADAEQALAGLGEQERHRGEMRITTAMIRLAQDDPHGATAALAPVLDGSAPLVWPPWLAHAFLLEAIANDEVGDHGAADRALERALDIAEPSGALLAFLLYPARDLLQRHVGLRTSHAALIAEILDLLAGMTPAPSGGPQPPLMPLSGSEIRVLRYLPTNLSQPEIANELHVSRNTVRTHMSHLYTKLGTHSRAEAVERARALGLLAPLARPR